MIKKVRINRKKVLNFQRKYAVTKAAEVIKLLEETAKTDPTIDIKKLRKNVLGNLVERHSDKADQDYWSMQLLIKLGLAPDPEAVAEDQNIDDEFTGKMTTEEREQQLKSMGLFIPKRNLEALNQELAKVAADNLKKIARDNAARLSNTQVKTLRKLGMSQEQIAEIDVDDNPFRDYELSGQRDVTDLLEKQKEFYEKLKEEYEKHLDKGI